MFRLSCHESCEVLLCLLSSLQVNQKWIIVHCETLPITISSGRRLEGFALTSEDRRPFSILFRFDFSIFFDF